MKAKVFLLAILFLSITGLNAQNFPIKEGITNDFSHMQVIDKTRLSCRYKESSVRDTLYNGKRQMIMLLEIGDKVSKYFELGNSKDHTPEYTKEHKALVDSLTKRNGGVVPRLSRFLRRDALFKDYPENKLTVIEKITPTSYRYEEDLQPQVWKLLNDTATINGYFCKKATTSFRGRDYEAWYAPEIPISDGPWKFRGLPGLIFKVEDSEKYFSFECISVEKNNPAIDIYIDTKEVVSTTKKDFNKIKKAYQDDPKGFIETATGGRITFGVASLPSIQQIPLELAEK
jgi:GLPGLI family protein